VGLLLIKPFEIPDLITQRNRERYVAFPMANVTQRVQGIAPRSWGCGIMELDSISTGNIVKDVVSKMVSY
jgi:hypothetical protein